MYNNQQNFQINQMVRCKKCGQLIPYNAKKCMYCGKTRSDSMILVWIIAGTFIFTFLVVIISLIAASNA